MISTNYARDITVNASPQQVFDVLTTGYRYWWTTPDSEFIRVGDRVKFTFAPNVSYWTFEAKILEPSRMVVLECIDALHIMTDDPSASTNEWLGTTVSWHIEPIGDQTRIQFEHDGLTPQLACYGICEAGWDLFFVESLKLYLDTGVGKPHSS